MIVATYLFSMFLGVNEPLKIQAVDTERYMYTLLSAVQVHTCTDQCSNSDPV